MHSIKDPAPSPTSAHPVHPAPPPCDQVCGLKWSPDDRELASGGNDNQLYVWSAQNQQALLRFTEHQAAVKAIAWSPHQVCVCRRAQRVRRGAGAGAARPLVSPLAPGARSLLLTHPHARPCPQHGLLVSGGGTADRCIRFWNTTTGQPLQCIDTGSQVRARVHAFVGGRQGGERAPPAGAAHPTALRAINESR